MCSFNTLSQLESYSMDFGIFNKDIKDLLNSKKALGIKVGLSGLIMVFISFPFYIFSETVGQLILTIGILIGIVGIFMHMLLMFNLKQ